MKDAKYMHALAKEQDNLVFSNYMLDLQKQIGDQAAAAQYDAYFSAVTYATPSSTISIVDVAHTDRVKRALEDAGYEVTIFAQTTVMSVSYYVYKISWLHVGHRRSGFFFA